MTSSAMHTFNVAEWIENDHPDFVPLTQPRAVGCWTKESHSTGGKYNYGSTEGKPDRTEAIEIRNRFLLHLLTILSSCKLLMQACPRTALPRTCLSTSTRGTLIHMLRAQRTMNLRQWKSLLRAQSNWAQSSSKFRSAHSGEQVHPPQRLPAPISRGAEPIYMYDTRLPSPISPCLALNEQE